MPTFLRDAAIPLDALARTSLHYPDQRSQLIEHVLSGTDWLIILRIPVVFSLFPIDPALKPKEKVGHIVARMIKKNPAMVVNDWIPSDFGDVGLQFDNGLCGRTLISVWEPTKEPRYLAAARKSGDWAMQCPLVLNWNYNGFSVRFLARLATSTGDGKYPEIAIKKSGTWRATWSNAKWTTV